MPRRFGTDEELRNPPGTCMFCGCTDDRDCHPSCAWINEFRNVCTRCDDAMTLLLCLPPRGLVVMLGMVQVARSEAALDERDADRALHLAIRAEGAPAARALDVGDVQRAVCEHFRLTFEALCSSQRRQAVTRPRMIGMYLCRELLRTSYTEIGERFGGKDHTTVLNACTRIRELLNGREGGEELSLAIEAIRGRLDR